MVRVGGLLCRGPCHQRWRPGEGSTMRRGGAGGLAARLMCAGFYRSSAIRREVPLTKCARGLGIA